MAGVRRHGPLAAGASTQLTIKLQVDALDDGVVIESGQVFWANPQAEENGRTNYFRLGFSSIPEERIAPGLERLRELTDRQLRR